MTAPPDLNELLAEWRQLTDAEGQAIRARNWQSLLHAQESKRQLQNRIELAIKNGTQSPAARSLAAELIVAELENHRDLAEQKRLAELEYAQLQNSARHLRGVRQAYGPTPANDWQGYC